MTKYLVVYYSRTGNTKKVAQKIAEVLKCDLEEIIDYKNHNGFIGFIFAVKDAVFEKTTKINIITKNLSDYDNIIIGTPVWALNVPPAIRTFIKNYSSMFKNVAFFCTMNIKGDNKVFLKLENLCNKKPLFTLSFKTKQIISGEYEKIIKEKLHSV